MLHISITMTAYNTRVENIAFMKTYIVPGYVGIDRYLSSLYLYIDGNIMETSDNHDSEPWR